MYIGNNLSTGRSEVFHFTATSGGETSISTATDGRSIRYTPGFCAVYLNGIRLHDSDFTATTGTSISLSALALNDVVIVEAAHTFSSADSVPVSGGTYTGPVTHSGAVTNSSTTTHTGAVTNSSTTTATGLITANGGIETDTNSKIKQKGSFLQSSFHQALTLGY
tara:strand:- start:218 stop:712 length:495 start_codon:yes stop_codon:yes gene_type:complete